MADPKFANLPGIAYDQPDLYETSDLPEADQAQIDAEHQEESDGIERINLNAKSAYEKFKGKNLDASGTDFSDRIGHRRKTGYESGEYVSGDVSGPETPQQKYLRLQSEMQSLKEEVQKLNDESSQDKKVDKDTVHFIHGVEDLHKQLINLKLEEVLGSSFQKHINDPQSALATQLISELDNFKETQSRTDSSKPSKEKHCETTRKDVLYELHFQPEITKFNQNVKLGEIEQRLQMLESVIGKDVEKSITLAGDTNNRSVLGAISILNSKLNLLEPSHIDQVDAHLTALSLRLNQLADKKSQLEDAEKISKISDTYQILKKTEVLCSNLPDIVSRMVSLKDLHEQALQFSVAITHLDATQQQIATGLKSNQDVLADLRQEFAKNIDIIQTNVKSLENRISALKK